MSYLDIKKKINYKNLINIYGRKKYLYIKWLIIQRYVINIKKNGVNRKVIKLKKICHITLRKLAIKNTKLNKLNTLSSNGIKLHDPNFRFYIRRVKKKKG